MENTQVNQEVKFSVQEVMMQVGIKSRITVDKYIHMGVLKPIRKPGRQPVQLRHKFFFRPEAVEKLKKYMQTHGRIQPKGMEPKEKVKETRKHRDLSATGVLAVNEPKKHATKDEILEQLDQAIEQVQHLENVIKMLSQSMRESDTSH